MKKANFTPLLEKIIWQDRIYSNKDTLRIVGGCIVLAFIVFITSASLLVMVDVSSFGSAPFWVACGIAVLIFTIWAGLRFIEYRHHDICVRKFAAVNEFNYTARTDGKNIFDTQSFLYKIHASSRLVYDVELVEGRHSGIPFSLGAHIAEYTGPEGERIIDNVHFLKMNLKKQFPHILVVGGGKALPHSDLKRVWTRPQPVTTKFQRHFQIYVLEGRKAWDIVIPPELQQNLLKLGTDFDIEIHNSSISFYRRGKLNLKQVPRFFELINEFK